jgi:hypothetical protein
VVALLLAVITVSAVWIVRALRRRFGKRQAVAG